MFSINEVMLGGLLEQDPVFQPTSYGEMAILNISVSQYRYNNDPTIAPKIEAKIFSAVCYRKDLVEKAHQGCQGLYVLVKGILNHRKIQQDENSEPQWILSVTLSGKNALLQFFQEPEERLEYPSNEKEVGEEANDASEVEFSRPSFEGNEDNLPF